MRSLLLLLMLGACNPAFGIEETAALPDADMRPDRDDDGVADVNDECIAPAVDGSADSDGDGVLDSIDSCPYQAMGPDGDGDGILDDCDPFPAAGGDRHLCTMAFGRAELNAQLWQPRPGEQTFAIASGYMIGFAGDGTPTSVIATDRVVPRSGSITIDLGWSAFPDENGGYALRVYVSAGTQRSPTDVACVFSNGPTGFSAGVLIGDSETPMNPALPGPRAEPVEAHIVRVQIQPGKTGDNILCAAGYSREVTKESEFVFATGRLDGELGEQGFGVDSGAAIVYNLLTYHNEGQPPLL